VEKIVETLQRQSRPVVLVGHSSAGFLLQSAAPQAPEKIDRPAENRETFNLGRGEPY
jgi:alpha-beta hydrolase superfamily lysophospholipase